MLMTSSFCLVCVSCLQAGAAGLGTGNAGLDGEQSFVGKVTSVKDGFCFMESRPGESNVYIPAQIADSSLISVGDIGKPKTRLHGIETLSCQEPPSWTRV
jgi:hypothetical protein